MTGRGVDQILPTPSDPEIFESYVRDARDYVRLAERANGPIPRSVDFAYVWGVALQALAHFAPAARIVNLETSVTAADDAWPGKGINYRMHPQNVGVLTAARLDVCVLANNHVIDWGVAGLQETIATLRGAGIRTAGAGADADEAASPAVVALDGGRHLLVYACGSRTSGIPAEWGAGREAPGVSLIDELSLAAARPLADRIAREKAAEDVVVVSIHWGSNWGYAIPREQRAFARARRQRRRRRRPRPFVAPRERHRDLPGQTDPLRLRQFSNGPRGNLGSRAVPRRLVARVLADHRCNDTRAHGAPDPAHAAATTCLERSLAFRRRLATGAAHARG